MCVGLTLALTGVIFEQQPARGCAINLYQLTGMFFVVKCVHLAIVDECRHQALDCLWLDDNKLLPPAIAQNHSRNRRQVQVSAAANVPISVLTYQDSHS